MGNKSKLYPQKVDITNCDKEEIHLINDIQSHGILIVCNPDDRIITAASSNASELFNESLHNLIGSKLTTILSEDIAELIFTKSTTNFSEFTEVEIDGKVHVVIFHSNDKHIIIEFELKDLTVDAITYQSQLSRIFGELGVVSNELEMCNRATELIKSFVGYDRVMIYQFDENWNGQVVSESKEDHLESWLGLHYPASDIPKQARALFLKQGVRIISNVHNEPVPLFTNATEDIDFSRSELRSVSPIHIEYLKNMKVNATLNAAIVFENNLWGLIACHNYSPKITDFYKRVSCKFLTQVFSTQLGLRTTNSSLEKINKSNEVRSQLIEQMSVHWDIEKGINNQDTSIVELTEASGAVAVLDKSLSRFGDTPSEKEIFQLIEGIKSETKEEIFHTNNLVKYFPEAKAYSKIASGMLCIFMSSEQKEAFIWFKPEKEKSVDWAGKPTKELIGVDDVLSPRNSFKKWTVEQKGFSEPWHDYEIASAKAMRDHIAEIILKKYDEILGLNDKLATAYKELESFSYSVSHDLRAPLRGIDGFAQILKEDYYETLDEFGKSAVETIISSTNKMNNLIDDILSFSGLGKKKTNFSTFLMKDLIYDVLDFLQVKNMYSNSEIVIKENLGKVYGDRSMIFQLMNNLISNALKYSSKKDNAQIIIGKLDESYFVEDNGIGFDLKHSEKIFGVFNRLVNDEYQGSGIGLALAKRVVEKHNGTLWVESKLGRGSTFHFNLKS